MNESDDDGADTRVSEQRPSPALASFLAAVAWLWQHVAGVVSALGTPSLPDIFRAIAILSMAFAIYMGATWCANNFPNF